jgi:hypothetical protein
MTLAPLSELLFQHNTSGLGQDCAVSESAGFFFSMLLGFFREWEYLGSSGLGGSGR